MKKRKLFFAILSSLFGLGIILIIVGLVFGGQIYGLSIGPLKNHKSVSHELSGISLTDTKDIKKLDFDLSAHDITFCQGDSFKISGGILSKNEVRDGIWRVQSNLSDHAFTFQIFGMRIPFLKTKNWEDEENEITITLPSNIKLDDITLDLSASDIEIDQLQCETAIIGLSAGSLSADSLIADTLNLSVSAGDIDIDQYQIAKSAELDCNMGDIAFGGSKCAFGNICNNLSADCAMGNIDIYGKLTGNTTVDCSMGDMALNLVGLQGNYNTSHASHSLGSINHSERRHRAHGRGQAIPTELYGDLDLNCSVGDIDITYLGE